MDFVTFVLFVCGFVLLIAGAEMLVRGASRLAVAAGISPLVVGLTVVAYGTSAPEVAVSVRSAWAGQPDIAVGNVVGSNIANILLVLGLSAAVAPLVVSRQVVRSSLPVMIAVAVLMWLTGLDGKISRWEGLLLFLGAVIFTWITVRSSRRETLMAASRQKEQQSQEEASLDPPPRLAPLRLVLDFVLIVTGLIALVFGARWLVEGAVKVAQVLGVSELVIGLTIVAVGTSLPEIATSIVAALRGQRDIAVGNAVGSNIFNVLLVIGLAALVAPSGIPVSRAALMFDMPVMIAISMACLPVFFTGWVIDRVEGLFFLGYYAAYTVYLYLSSTGNSAAGTFRMVIFCVAVPITAMLLVAATVRAFLRRRGGSDADDPPAE